MRPSAASPVARWTDPPTGVAVGLQRFQCRVGRQAGVALAADDSAGRGEAQRVALIVDRLCVDMPAVRHLAPLLRGLLRDDPANRWGLSQATSFLRDIDHASRAPAAASSAPKPPGLTVDQLSDASIDRLLADGLTYVVGTMTPDEPRLWPTLDGDRTDPCNIQYGAAGVLGVLTRAAAHFGDQRLLDGVSRAVAWLDKRLFEVPRLLPGLYFGRSGPAWALYDAARLLGDDDRALRALELATAVPIPWSCPDICHGVAGAGLAQLHLWVATGDPELKQRVVMAADDVLGAARERDGHWVWPVPDAFRGSLAGRAHYGFGHGVAGVAAFLLAAGLATGSAEYLDGATRAAETLAAAAEIEGDAAWWPVVDRGDERRSVRMRHWCSGSAGVGTFLVRLWAVTGESRWRTLAQAAAAAVHQDRWYSNTSTCHGLSGHGDFLLDVANFTGDQRYHDRARELANVMDLRHTFRDGGLMVLPDETGANVTVGYNTGLSGCLAFLLRLRHGGPRWWMADEVHTLAGTSPARPTSNGKGGESTNDYRPQRAGAPAG